MRTLEPLSINTGGELLHCTEKLATKMVVFLPMSSGEAPSRTLFFSSGGSHFPNTAPEPAIRRQLHSLTGSGWRAEANGRLRLAETMAW